MSSVHYIEELIEVSYSLRILQSTPHADVFALRPMDMKEG
jgi:hypothetical protein